MFLYTVTEAIIAVIAGILITICTKKADRVTYSKLDKIGQVTNVLLCLFYVGFSFFYLFLGMIANPLYSGFLGFLGWIESIIMASAALFCGIGLADPEMGAIIIYPGDFLIGAVTKLRLHTIQHNNTH